MRFKELLYRSVLKRTSTLCLGIVIGAVSLDRGANYAGDKFFEYYNRGVC